MHTGHVLDTTEEEACAYENRSGGHGSGDPARRGSHTQAATVNRGLLDQPLQTDRGKGSPATREGNQTNTTNRTGLRRVRTVQSAYALSANPNNPPFGNTTTACNNREARGARESDPPRPQQPADTRRKA